MKQVQLQKEQGSVWMLMKKQKKDELSIGDLKTDEEFSSLYNAKGSAARQHKSDAQSMEDWLVTLQKNRQRTKYIH